jgi:AAA domain, putative AbiEii toxin, Type IV TA system/AAA domain
MATTFRRLRIQGWRQFVSIDIELHPRLTIITGANGAGKSTLLTFFTRHFGYNRNFIGTPASRGGIISYTFGVFDSLRRGLRRASRSSQGLEIGTLEYSDGRTATLRLPPVAGLNYNVTIEEQQQVDGIHVDSHRPPSIYRHVPQFPATPPSVSDLGNSLNSEFMHYYSSGSVSQGSLHHIKMTLITMSIFGHGNATMEPIPRLIELFSGFEEKLQLLLPKSLGFQKLVIRSPEVLLSTTTGDFPLDAASGGVIKLFEVAWQLYFYSQGRRQFVVTFDEPENHLHPSMQKTFLPNILAAFPNAQMIAVTHSPFVISALRESYVYVLRYADTELTPVEGDDDQSIRGLMEFIDALVSAWVNAAPEHKALLLRDLYSKHLKDSDEFAASSQAYIEHLKQKGVLA